MKAIILAGGYAKRLWPLTKETPKPLLDVGGKEIITRIIEKIEEIDGIDEMVISTNEKFGVKFGEYIDGREFKKEVKLVVEPTMGEGEKLGSIGGMNFLIDHMKLSQDVLVIGGDNIFGFDVAKFIEYYKEKDASIIALKKIEDKELIKKYGVCVLDESRKIIEFQEKPPEPKSDLASTACYLFKLDDIMLIKKYLSEGNSPDAMGSFIVWLINQTKVCGFEFSEEWFDIGSFEQLDEAKERYSTQDSSGKIKEEKDNKVEDKGDE